MAKEKVIKVFDGDTLITNRRKYAVRLEGVDTPEKRQNGYQEAKQRLQKLILGQNVIIKPVARDEFKRPIAQVKVGNQSVNTAMKRYQKK